MHLKGKTSSEMFLSLELSLPEVNYFTCEFLAFVQSCIQLTAPSFAARMSHSRLQI